uniref:Uncharacterized protein n=1 Tax=Mesocestoides corti TaxID=53468 RepID=A0A5K3F8H6_MESCO
MSRSERAQSAHPQQQQQQLNLRDSLIIARALSESVGRREFLLDKLVIGCALPEGGVWSRGCASMCERGVDGS